MSTPPPETHPRKEWGWIAWLGGTAAAVTAVLAANEFLGTFGWILLAGLPCAVGGVMILRELPRRHNWRRVVAIICAVAAFGAAITLEAWGNWDRLRGPHVNRTTPLMLCSADTSVCRTVVAKLRRGTSVTQVCYHDDLSLGITHRFLYVETSRGQSGYAFPVAVSNQRSSPDCDDVGWMEVTNSLLLNGQLHPRVEHGAPERPIPGAALWAIFEKRITAAAEGQSPSCTAATADLALACYQRSHVAGADNSTAPPRGALIFLRCSKQASAVLSLGNGWVALLHSGQSLVVTDRSAITCSPLGIVGRDVLFSS